jgi:hypothetical protein
MHIVMLALPSLCPSGSRLDQGCARILLHAVPGTGSPCASSAPALAASVVGQRDLLPILRSSSTMLRGGARLGGDVKWGEGKLSELNLAAKDPLSRSPLRLRRSSMALNREASERPRRRHVRTKFFFFFWERIAYLFC